MRESDLGSATENTQSEATLDAAIERLREIGSEWARLNVETGQAVTLNQAMASWERKQASE